MRGGGEILALLVRRLIARDEKHLVELELLADGLRQQQVPEVRRIERAAKYSYPLRCQRILLVL
jgi:hypothetical protein